MKECNTSFSSADRVVRTELIHMINIGHVQRYKDNGHNKLEILVAHDERTCGDCGPGDGAVVSIDSSDIVSFIHVADLH